MPVFKIWNAEIWNAEYKRHNLGENKLNLSTKTQGVVGHGLEGQKLE